MAGVKVDAAWIASWLTPSLQFSIELPDPSTDERSLISVQGGELGIADLNVDQTAAPVWKAKRRCRPGAQLGSKQLHKVSAELLLRGVAGSPLGSEAVVQLQNGLIEKRDLRVPNLRAEAHERGDDLECRRRRVVRNLSGHAGFELTVLVKKILVHHAATIRWVWYPPWRVNEA